MHHVLGITAAPADTGGAGTGADAGAGVGVAAIGIVAGNGAGIDALPSILISSTGSSLASTTGLALCTLGRPVCIAGLRFPTAGGTGS
jgi:hypothetical protein